MVKENNKEPVKIIKEMIIVDLLLKKSISWDLSVNPDKVTFGTATENSLKDVTTPRI